MGMHVGSEDTQEEVIAVINTTPLVDVMLVLLIIFLITIPVMNSSIPVQLPEEQNRRYEAQADHITLVVNLTGEIYWNDQIVTDPSKLVTRLTQFAVDNPQSEVHIRGDQNTSYESISELIVLIQNAGIHKIAFITQTPAQT